MDVIIFVTALFIFGLIAFFTEPPMEDKYGVKPVTKTAKRDMAKIRRQRGDK